jgi:uncharacterized protein YecE (DUF72 family)
VLSRLKYYIGTSGWHYDHWREEFYPTGLPKSRWLEFYSKQFSTVELNNSFYRLPSEKAFANWRDSSPEAFVFAVKVSRFITHIKRLKDTAEPVANFMARASLLEGKLGPLLYQLPGSMKRDYQVLEEFLKTLPENSRNVFEFRDDSWFDRGIFELLRHYNAGFCIYDMPDLTTPVIATSDFAYVRFHGSRQLYSSCYSEKELEDWALKIAGLEVRKVYAYFNNDAGGFAIGNALMLRHLLEASS